MTKAQRNDSNGDTPIRTRGKLAVRTQLRAGFSSEEGFPRKALITEVGFPALDASSKDAAKM